MDNRVLLGLGNTSGSSVVSESPSLAGRRRKDAMIAIHTADPGEIPAGVLEALQAKRVKFADKVHTFTKAVNNTNMKMLLAGDNKTTGFRTIDKDKLTGTNLFVVSAIQVLLAYAVATEDTEANKFGEDPSDLVFQNVNFATYEPRLAVTQDGNFELLAVGEAIPAGTTIHGLTQELEYWYPGFSNGFLTLKSTKSKHIVDEVPMAAFANQDGIFVLDNPRPLIPDNPIELNIDWGNNIVLPDNITEQAIICKVNLYGTELIDRG